MPTWLGQPRESLGGAGPFPGHTMPCHQGYPGVGPSIQILPEGGLGWGPRVLGCLGDSCRPGWPTHTVRAAVMQDLAGKEAWGGPGTATGLAPTMALQASLSPAAAGEEGWLRSLPWDLEAPRPCLQGPSLVSYPPAWPGWGAHRAARGRSRITLQISQVYPIHDITGC